MQPTPVESFPAPVLLIMRSSRQETTVSVPVPLQRKSKNIATFRLLAEKKNHQDLSYMEACTSQSQNTVAARAQVCIDSVWLCVRWCGLGTLCIEGRHLGHCLVAHILRALSFVL